MKAVILAGGLGTRISEESDIKPKPMIEIGGNPILWHIMKGYAMYGITDFIICCGYKGYVIKEYFSNYFLHTSDVTFDLENNTMSVHQQRSEKWKVTLVDTGENTMTGGRIKRVRDYVKDDDSFCLTYGDGLSDVDINKLVSFHNKQGTLATLTSVYPPSRFGALDIVNNKVKTFKEKPQDEVGRVNGGFFILSPKVIDLIDNDTTVWEEEPLEKLSNMSELSSFEHNGFWQPMDTLRDKNLLESLWTSNKASWKKW